MLVSGDFMFKVRVKTYDAVIQILCNDLKRDEILEENVVLVDIVDLYEKTNIPDEVFSIESWSIKSVDILDYQIGDFEFRTNKPVTTVESSVMD